jgi:hypothetical protein
MHADIYSFYDREKSTVGTQYNNGETRPFHIMFYKCNIHPVSLQRPFITDARNDKFDEPTCQSPYFKCSRV